MRMEEKLVKSQHRGSRKGQLEEEGGDKFSKSDTDDRLLPAMLHMQSESFLISTATTNRKPSLKIHAPVEYHHRCL